MDSLTPNFERRMIRAESRLLMSPQDDLHWRVNSLSLRSGERVRERGVFGKLRWFTVNVIRAFPSPRPSPHSSVVERGRRRHHACSMRFGVYPVDFLVSLLTLQPRNAST